MNYTYFFLILIIVQMACLEKKSSQIKENQYLQFSGIYPHLAHYNNEGECGTGAVVPWVDKLWVVSYGPHFPDGSSDKLYEITQELTQIIREESIGGTPANRMIHPESNQLFIGPYAIDELGAVRTIPYANMPGRHTGNARHLTDPTNKIYYATMEEGFYEVDVNTLEVIMLYPDGNRLREENDMDQFAPHLPGDHGKGLYSGQGVMVYSNNGEAVPEALKKFDIESGVLAEWNGEDWKVVRRNQFVEVTGPGGIYGNENPDSDPIWATGFDHKSLLMGVRDHGSWSFFRLPKASHSYDGAHGWNTEWPRIRDIGTSENPDYLMTMHGMFWKFPKGFTSENPAGIRPRSAYLKVIGDFTRWNDQLVFGCDDSAQREFLNKRKAKGGIEGPGQSNSNLWFTSIETPDQLGPSTASGAVWLNEEVKSNEYSEPFLFAGWPNRSAWVQNHGEFEVNFTFEMDSHGDGNWSVLKSRNVGAGQSDWVRFSSDEVGEWIRVTVDTPAKATVQFAYSSIEKRSMIPNPIFEGLALNDESKAVGGLLYGLGNDRRALGISARNEDGSNAGYYEMDAQMNLIKKDDPKTQKYIDKKFAIPEHVIAVEKSSILIVDDSGRRWRLPKGNNKFDDLINNAQMRVCREVATERDLFNAHGTFYELPAENADGFAKIRPITSHHFRIHDYASYRGLLIMTGINPGRANDNAHIIKSEDGKAALWAGVIDDLWKLGKPVGEGGPWKNEAIAANVPSDPYLVGFYDKRTVSIHHDNTALVNFTIEVNPMGHGPWMVYEKISVEPGKSWDHQFPDDFQTRWIRVIADKDCNATAWFVYK